MQLVCGGSHIYFHFLLGRLDVASKPHQNCIRFIALDSFYTLTECYVFEKDLRKVFCYTRLGDSFIFRAAGWKKDGLDF